MVSTPYTRGRSREYQALKILRKDDWLCSRSAASHSAIDIFACKDGKVLLVQVKSGKARVTEKDRLDLSKWKQESGSSVEIWFFGRKKGIEKEVIQ
ncbi:hypothetical protein ACFL96_19295 [Thermoproteota archaeon]